MRVFGLGMVGRLGKADSAAGIEASGTEASAAVAGNPGQIILGVCLNIKRAGSNLAVISPALAASGRRARCTHVG